MQSPVPSVDRRLAFALALCAAGCKSAEPAATATLRVAREIFGTEFSVVVVDPDGLRSVERANRALDAAEDVARVLDRWDEASELAALNRDPHGGWLDASCALVGALEIALDAYAQTGGAFDVRVAASLRAHGYYGAPIGAPAALTVPLGDELRVQREPCRVWRARTLELDCGGFAKGLAVRRAGERLHALGVDNAFVDGGASSGFALGAGPDGRGWPYEAPPEFGAPHPYRLVDRAVSVSRQHTLDDARALEASVIVDPASGKLAPPSTVLVIGTDPCAADYWTTALVARGARAAPPEFVRLGDAWSAAFSR